MLSLETLRSSFFSGLPRYRYLELLGRGGCGLVFKALDSELEEEIAIKVLSVLFEDDPDSLLARFKREISLNRKIKHPNVARLYDFGMSGTLPYITMEFVAGTDLSKRISQDGPMPSGVVITILRQIALGASAAHRAGIIHRDLKPQNIMIDAEGAVAILDFGMARGRIGSNLTLKGEAVGTPHYMSPEQARGQPTDARSDVYSIGVIAFEMLTGALLFDGDSPLEVATLQVEARVPENRLTERRVPQDLGAIVLRCLEKSAGDRFQSAAELEERLALLGGSLAGVPSLAAVASEPEIYPADLEMSFEAPDVSKDVRSPHPHHVLIVDDEPMVRDLISIYLKDAGYEVEEASTGQDALEKLMERRADLILMDVKMPVMDGFDAMRVIRSQAEFARVPIILMSTFLERSRLAFAIQAGATDFLSKPLDMPTLVQKVRKLLEAEGPVPRLTLR